MNRTFDEVLAERISIIANRENSLSISLWDSDDESELIIQDFFSTPSDSEENEEEWIVID